MKTLIYSSALLYLLLLSASCNKADLVGPGGTATPPPPPPACDSTKLVNYTLLNSTGIGTFKIEFSGNKTDSIFDFPANGSKTIAIKPGVYNVHIYPGGIYSPHQLSLNGSSPVYAPTASYSNISVTPCSASNLNASITN